MLDADTSPIYTPVDGYQCDLAALNDGERWAMIVTGLPAADEHFIANMDRKDREWEAYKALPRPGKTVAERISAYSAASHVLTLVEGRDSSAEVLYSAEAEQFAGIAVTGGRESAFGWTSLDKSGWRVEVWQGGTSRVLARSASPLTAVSLVADADGRLSCAWAGRFGDGTDVIYLLLDTAVNGGMNGPDTRSPVMLEGRLPHLVHLEDGTLVGVVFERVTGAESHVYFATVGESGVSEPIRVSSAHPVNMQPRALRDGEGVLVVWTAAPVWRLHQFVDQQRWIELRRVDMDSGEVSDGPGTDCGALPIPAQATPRAKNGQPMNMTPGNPRLTRFDGRLLCSFRVHDPLRRVGEESGPVPRITGLEMPGWVTSFLCWNGRDWSEPRQLSGSIGHPETGYGICSAFGKLLAAEPVFENIGRAPPRRHRIEVRTVSPSDAPPLHDGKAVLDVVETRPANAITYAPVLDDPPDGLHLVFGDLHNHSTLSSCYAINDGSPLDNLRWHGDALGEEVVTFTDHIRVSDADFRYQIDLLERCGAPERVPIYATEWAKPYFHNITFYTYDKEVMKRLRVVLLAEFDFTRIYDWIMGETPPGSVVVMRHYH